jgi:hypothetical protein
MVGWLAVEHKIDTSEEPERNVALGASFGAYVGGDPAALDRLARMRVG